MADIEKYSIDELSLEPGYLVMLHKYEPGPIYIVTTETDVFVSDEPFTIEEAEEQHPDFDGAEAEMLEDIKRQEIDERANLEDALFDSIELEEQE